MIVRLAICSAFAVLFAPDAFAQASPAAIETPVAVVTESVAAAPVVITKLTLPSPDGSQMRQYDVSDFSFSLARSYSYTVNDAGGEVSAIFQITGGVDEHLLSWARQTASGPEQARNVTVRSDNPNAPKVFELEGARVIGLSLSGGAMNMMSLQVGLKSLTIDGVRMN